MSSLALMRWLESAPKRYDTGMKLITLGRVDRIRDAMVEASGAAPGKRILEIGCGTGAVTERLVRRGSLVTSVDCNPEMIERAKNRLASAGPGEVEWIERTAAEIDRLPKAAFDAVVAAFSLSEMPQSERAFVLREAFERLRPGGALAVADEVTATALPARMLLAVLRLPQAAVASLIGGSPSRPLEHLRDEIQAAGFRVKATRTFLAGGFAAVGAERPP
jgi:ubiquinone/menaquinone biosynthesis C-methylase UbiE